MIVSINMAQNTGFTAAISPCTITNSCLNTRSKRTSRSKRSRRTMRLIRTIRSVASPCSPELSPWTTAMIQVSKTEAETRTKSSRLNPQWKYDTRSSTILTIISRRKITTHTCSSTPKRSSQKRTPSVSTWMPIWMALTMMDTATMISNQCWRCSANLALKIMNVPIATGPSFEYTRQCVEECSSQLMCTVSFPSIMLSPATPWMDCHRWCVRSQNCSTRPLMRSGP
mmetsp:Transcript_1690/g.4086  ORF Transcript_1690/g.4086 Transcript_1690/m.4086 type:complete len:227 (-) Transcript_1690:399-1079(-)